MIRRKEIKRLQEELKRTRKELEDLEHHLYKVKFMTYYPPKEKNYTVRYKGKDFKLISQEIIFEFGCFRWLRSYKQQKGSLVFSEKSNMISTRELKTR